MFVGRFDRQLDEKARLVIPAEFVDQLQGPDREAIYVTPGRDGCLWLVPRSHFEGPFARAVLGAGGARDVLADQFFHECQLRSIDKAGRLVLDEAAREMASIPAPGGGEPPQVVVCGSGSYMQVWGRAAYAENAAPRDRVVRLLPQSGTAVPEAGE